jgi:fatty acid-binding protein DegV
VALGASLFNLHPAVSINGGTGDITVGKKYRGKSVAAAERWLQDSLGKFRAECDPALAFFVHTPDMPPVQYEPMQRIAVAGLSQMNRIVLGPIGCVIVSHVGGNCYALVGMKK